MCVCVGVCGCVFCLLFFWGGVEYAFACFKWTMRFCVLLLRFLPLLVSGRRRCALWCFPPSCVLCFCFIKWTVRFSFSFCVVVLRVGASSAFSGLCVCLSLSCASFVYRGHENPPTHPPTPIQQSQEPNEPELEEFLINQLGFNPDRVKSGIAKLKASSRRLITCASCVVDVFLILSASPCSRQAAGD